MPLLTAKSRARVVIAYKNFAANKGLSHIGLGVSAMQNCKALIAGGYIAEVLPISSSNDLLNNLKEDRSQSNLAHHIPITHVVISAPWIPSTEIAAMVSTYHDIKFAIVSHSNIGFLQADPGAIRLMREYSSIASMYDNLQISGNSADLVRWWEEAYGTPIICLPNMYPISSVKSKRWSGGTLRIGCFCAIRPYKNVLTAAAAALEIAVRLRVTDLEFYISGGREEGGGGTITSSIKELYANVPRAKLIQNNWQGWYDFVITVGAMDIMLQPSYTESFMMTVADGISQGVPSVTSDAITWVPDNWKARSDSASDIASTGIALLYDPNAARYGLDALNAHNRNAMAKWNGFMNIRYQGV